MRKLFIFILLFLISVGLGFSQSLTTVTATITDLTAQPFVSGISTAEYQRPNNAQGITPVIAGVPINERPSTVGMNGAGTFTINLANLALVSPAGGAWRFTLCPNASASCSIVTTQGVVGASVNLSATLSAGVTTISVPAQPTISRAYKDTEVILASGVVWLDVTANVIKYVDALGIIHTLGGGVTGATPGGGLILTGTTLGLRTDCLAVQVLIFDGVSTWNCGFAVTGSGTPGKIPKWQTTATLTNSASSDIVAEFCISSAANFYLSADGTCHDVTVTAFYQTIQRNAVPLTQRPIFNFSQRFLATDNGGATRTDIDANAPGTGNFVATYASSPGASTAFASFDGNGNLVPSVANFPGTTTNTPQKISLSSPVALVANTQTIVLSKSVTFPSTGGPYRADIRYGAWITAGPDACAGEAIDTTNNLSFALSAQDGNGGGFMALVASEITTNSYIAGNTATFTLQIQCNVGHSVTVNSGLFTFTPATATFLSITPILTN